MIRHPVAPLINEAKEETYLQVLACVSELM